MREEFKRAESWLEENLFVQELLKRSHLKERTFKALLLRSWAEDATFEEVAERLGINQAGAWKCWQRGKESIIRAYLTLKLAIHAGLLDAEAVDLLIRDLMDYSMILSGEGDREEILYRIERRTIDLIQKLQKGVRASLE